MMMFGIGFSKKDEWQVGRVIMMKLKKTIVNKLDDNKKFPYTTNVRFYMDNASCEQKPLPIIDI